MEAASAAGDALAPLQLPGSSGARGRLPAGSGGGASDAASPFGDAAFLNLHDQVEAAFRKGLQVHIAAVLKRRGAQAGRG